MQLLISDTWWEDPNHRTLYPGEEHARLEKLELKTGHKWERTSIGEIKFFGRENHCQGPTCLSCGFSFCVECGIPIRPPECTGVPPVLHANPGLATALERVAA